MIGEVLDGWQVVRLLGEGGSGDAYLVEHGDGRKAAAKVLSVPASADRALLDKLFADSRAASQVNHVAMADLLGCGVHASGRAFVVMELLEGKTLSEALVELGSVSDMESFADLGWQMATALAAAHAAGLVHAGLKPDSVFLTFPAWTTRPVVKLLDFGMAKLATSVRHSQTGSLLGAPLYMSPELGRGLPDVDHRTDIYSLGCMFFEMLCGRPPFVREGTGELIVAHATEPPPSVNTLAPSVPQPIAGLVGRMLTKNPAVRPQSMAEVAGLLEKYFDCPAPAVVLAPPVPPPVQMPGAMAAAGDVAGIPAAPVGAVAPTLVLQATPGLPERTALLPPGEGGERLWCRRLHQTTVRIEAPPLSTLPSTPPERGVAVRQAGARARPERPPAAAAPLLNWPIVILSASVIVVAGCVVILLVRRPPRRATVPAAPPAPAAVEARFEPRPPRPSPPPPVALPVPVVADRPAGATEARRERSKSSSRPAPAANPEPASRRPARHW